MTKKNTLPTLNEGKVKPPRFDAAITEEEFKQALTNCESWDSARPIIIALLTKDSRGLLHEYQGGTDTAGSRWIDTMNLLTEYRDHLVQCLHMCSCALERVSIIGEHLAKGMEHADRHKPIVRTYPETVH